MCIAKVCRVACVSRVNLVCLEPHVKHTKVTRFREGSPVQRHGPWCTCRCTTPRPLVHLPVHNATAPGAPAGAQQPWCNSPGPKTQGRCFAGLRRGVSWRGMRAKRATQCTWCMVTNKHVWPCSVWHRGGGGRIFVNARCPYGFPPQGKMCPKTLVKVQRNHSLPATRLDVNRGRQVYV